MLKEKKLDYNKSRAYWEELNPSILGVYSMEGFGFPLTTAKFRFNEEKKIMFRLLKQLPADASILDLGSGVGTWTKYFANYFGKITSVEYSQNLCDKIKSQCKNYPNVNIVCEDAKKYVPNDVCDSIFMGGLLTCLLDEDIDEILTKLRKSLTTNGIVICRESTIAKGTQFLQKDNYQIAYRSLITYKKIFEKNGFTVQTTQANIAYNFLEIPCTLMKKWKSLGQFWPSVLLPVVGRIVYFTLKIGYPWNYLIFSKIFLLFNINYPLRTNHFFLLKKRHVEI